MRASRAGLTLLVAVAAVAITSCGGDEPNTPPAADRSATATATASAEAGLTPVLIKTHITFRETPVGEVLGGSFIGDAAFCPGGRFRDRFDRGTVFKTFRCRNGRLTISFNPRGPIQSGSWKVESGNGRFEGLRGHGWMVVRPQEGAPPEGRETFTGTVAG